MKKLQKPTYPHVPLPPDSMYSQWFLYSTTITTIHTGSPGHKLAILLVIQAFRPQKHLAFTSIKWIEKLSVLLDCCECSSFGCINVSHAFKPHVAPRPNVCIPCGNSLTTLCPKQGCEQVMTQGYHHGKSCWIISCVTHNFKLDVSKSPGSYVDSSIKVKSLVVSIILVTPGHLHSQKEPVWCSAAL